MGNTELVLAFRANHVVHPHACGEHDSLGTCDNFTNGSSPRVWGTRSYFLKLVLIIRFIPTRVGNTNTQTVSTVFQTVHPHACGEHRAFMSLREAMDGSSPRVWGTPTGSPQGQSRSPVHPHACGEHLLQAALTKLLRGSSPRVWGTLGYGSVNKRSRRFIPTRVGNTEFSVLPKES